MAADRSLTAAPAGAAHRHIARDYAEADPEGAGAKWNIATAELPEEPS